MSFDVPALQILQLMIIVKLTDDPTTPKAPLSYLNRWDRTRGRVRRPRHRHRWEKIRLSRPLYRRGALRGTRPPQDIHSWVAGIPNHHLHPLKLPPSPPRNPAPPRCIHKQLRGSKTPRITPASSDHRCISIPVTRITFRRLSAPRRRGMAEVPPPLPFYQRR